MQQSAFRVFVPSSKKALLSVRNEFENSRNRRFGNLMKSLRLRHFIYDCASTISKTGQSARALNTIDHQIRVNLAGTNGKTRILNVGID